MKRLIWICCGAISLGLLIGRFGGAGVASADDPPKRAAGDKTAAQDNSPPAPPAPAISAETYTLRYKFRPNETIRWQVTHRAKVDTTVSGTSQVAETTSSSIKVWRVGGVDDKKGWATFAHSVESVDMRQQLSGREEVHYNSLTDKEPPIGFEEAAKSVGVVLSIITLDAQGSIVRREDKHPQASATAAAQVTVSLPAESIPVGHTWSQPHDVDVTLPGGQVKKIKTRQVFALAEVTRGIATITVDTQVLTPIHDPAIEAQLIQRETAGSMKFDIAAGRVIGQQMDLDKHVLGFSGNASSLHYVTRFTEELLPESQATARHSAGPEPPASMARQTAPNVRKSQAAKTKASSNKRSAGKPSNRAR